MKRNLIITEKHSTAKPFIKLLGLHGNEHTQSGSSGLTGYVDGTNNGQYWAVTWCFGHLLETYMPDDYDATYKRWSLDDLPIVPDEWKYKPTGTASAKRQLKVIRSLVNDGRFDRIYHAGDCDREGELLVREVLRSCKQKSLSDAELYRCWYGSVTSQAIEKALTDAKSLSEYDGLYDAADARQKLDWLYGINLTRAYTVLYGETRNVGRVVSPTINLIVEREREIETFVPQGYLIVGARLSRDGESFVAGARYDDVERGHEVERRIKGKIGTITDVTRTERVQSVMLYDLTSLQADASRLLGMEPSETMATMQYLYENGLATYPRTNSDAITPDDVSTVEPLIEPAASIVTGNRSVISRHAGAIPWDMASLDVSRIVRTPDSADKEASHTGLCPTERGLVSLDALPNERHARDLLLLVTARLVMACSEPRRVAVTQVSIDIDGEPFSASGSVVVTDGYEPIEDIALGAIGVTKRRRREVMLPRTEVGQDWDVQSVDSEQRETKPPARYTTDTLLTTMRNIASVLPEKDMRDVMHDANAGLGTSSSRDKVIETIKRNGFVTTDESRHLHPTEKATGLMAILPDDIKTPVMTARMEAMLDDVATGRDTEDRVLDNAIGVVRRDIDTVRNMPIRAETSGKHGVATDAKVIARGGCPVCGGNVVETKRGYTCRECGFVIWKTIAKRKIPQRECRSLCEDGMSTQRLDGFKSKAGRGFSCWLYLDDNAKVRFDFSEDGDDARSNYVTKNMAHRRDKLN